VVSLLIAGIERNKKGEKKKGEVKGVCVGMQHSSVKKKGEKGFL